MPEYESLIIVRNNDDDGHSNPDSDSGISNDYHDNENNNIFLHGSSYRIDCHNHISKPTCEIVDSDSPAVVSDPTSINNEYDESTLVSTETRESSELRTPKTTIATDDLSSSVSSVRRSARICPAPCITATPKRRTITGLTKSARIDEIYKHIFDDGEEERNRVTAKLEKISENYVDLPDFIAKKDRIPGVDLAPINEIQYWSTAHGLDAQTITEYIHESRQKCGFNEEQSLAMLYYHRFNVAEARIDIVKYKPLNPNVWSKADDLTFRLALLHENWCRFNCLKKQPIRFQLLKQVLPHKTMSEIDQYYYITKMRSKRCRAPDDDLLIEADGHLFRMAMIYENLYNCTGPKKEPIRYQLLSRVLPYDSIIEFTKHYYGEEVIRNKRPHDKENDTFQLGSLRTKKKATTRNYPGRRQLKSTALKLGNTPHD